MIMRETPFKRGFSHYHKDSFMILSKTLPLVIKRAVSASPSSFVAEGTSPSIHTFVPFGASLCAARVPFGVSFARGHVIRAATAVLWQAD